MNKSLSILFVVAAVLAIQASATVVDSCGSSSTDPTSVQLSNCTTPRCILVKGQSISISMTFTPTTTITSLTIRVTALMGGTPGALPGLDGQNACTNIRTASDNQPATCPLTSGVAYVYVNDGELSETYPSVDSRLHWALQENGVDRVCMEVDIRLV